MIDKFLKGLRNYLNAFTNEPPVSHLVGEWSSGNDPSSNEPLIRFIYDRKAFSRDQVKHSAFMPLKNKSTGRFETSVFRVFGLASGEIVELSRSARQDKQPKAAAHNKYQHIPEIGLQLDPNNEPERHADIIGWPHEKFEQIDLAQKLAAFSDLERYEDNN